MWRDNFFMKTRRRNVDYNFFHVRLQQTSLYRAFVRLTQRLSIRQEEILSPLCPCASGAAVLSAAFRRNGSGKARVVNAKHAVCGITSHPLRSAIFRARLSMNIAE